MTNKLLYDDESVSSFVSALKKELPDTRDNRGKRHSLAFVIVAFVLATLCGRQQLSGVYRFILNRIDWLREVTQIYDAQPISRAHLPRLLDKLNWSELDKIIVRYFGVKIEKTGDVIAYAVPEVFESGDIKSEGCGHDDGAKSEEGNEQRQIDGGGKKSGGVLMEKH